MIILSYLAIVNLFYYDKAAVMKDSMFFISHHIAQMVPFGVQLLRNETLLQKTKTTLFLGGTRIQVFFSYHDQSIKRRNRCTT